jgi:selenium metabolism protein YedF
MNSIIDCKGLQCPMPVVKTKKYFDSIESGEGTIIVDNLVAKNNVVKLAQGSGNSSVVEEKEGLYFIKITKQKLEAKVKAEVKDEVKGNKKFTLVVSTEKLGVGDDKLGEMLMKSYIFALSEADTIPSDILFLNGGVNLTIETSLVLDSLKKLVERGANILVCGACLDFYNVKDKLSIGEISNMYTIVELMNTADKTIKI